MGPLMGQCWARVGPTRDPFLQHSSPNIGVTYGMHPVGHDGTKRHDGPKLGPPWAMMGPGLGPTWAIMGTSLGTPWAMMGPSGPMMGPSLGPLRAMMGPSLGPPGATMGPSLDPPRCKARFMSHYGNSHYMNIDGVSDDESQKKRLSMCPRALLPKDALDPRKRPTQIQSCRQDGSAVELGPD
jgi:hypothetical protein